MSGANFGLCAGPHPPRGRPPDRCSLIEIPVEGQFWRRLNPHTVLVSAELKQSRNVIAPLESVIRELAQ